MLFRSTPVITVIHHFLALVVLPPLLLLQVTRLAGTGSAGVATISGWTSAAGVGVELVRGCAGTAGVAEMRVELVCGSAGTAAIGATLRDDDAWCCPSADADGMVSLSKDN